MPPTSSFSGGYDEETVKKLRSVVLPDKIRCKQCKKYKIQGGYSKKQLSELQKRAARFGKLDSSTGAYIKCRQCVGQQVEELTCCICDEVKGLNGFSKVQRRNPDSARCLRCVTLHVNTEPGVNVDEEEDDDSEEFSNPYESDRDDDFASESAFTINNFSKLNFTETSHAEPGVRRSFTASGASEDGVVDFTQRSKENLRSESVGPSTITRDGSVWLEQSRRGRSNFGGVGIPFTGYDSQGLAHSRFRAPSTAASEQSWGAVASTGSSFRSAPVELTKSGFAKTRESRSTAGKPSILDDDAPVSKAKHRTTMIVPDIDQEDNEDDDEDGVIMEW